MTLNDYSVTRDSDSVVFDVRASRKQRRISTMLLGSFSTLGLVAVWSANPEGRWLPLALLLAVLLAGWNRRLRLRHQRLVVVGDRLIRTYESGTIPNRHSIVEFQRERARHVVQVTSDPAHLSIQADSGDLILLFDFPLPPNRLVELGEMLSDALELPLRGE